MTDEVKVLGFEFGSSPDSPSVRIIIEFLPGFSLIEQLGILGLATKDRQLVTSVIESIDEAELQAAMQKHNQGE